MSKYHHRSRSPLDLWYPSLITSLSSCTRQQIFATPLHCAFDRLFPHFELQERVYFWGVACASISLNTLLSSPKWTQSTLHSEVAQAYIFYGITLANLAHVLSICGLPSIIRHCEDKGIKAQFRYDVENQQNFIIVNYWRQFEGSDKDHSLR